MKEIIYLDTNLVNSLLAQLDQGLILKQIVENNTSEVTSKTEGQQSNLGVTIPIPFLKFSGNDTEISKSDIVYSLGNRELMETAIDDYSLDLLLDKIGTKIQTSPNIVEGDYVESTDKFTVFDFSYTSKSMNPEHIRQFLPDQFKEYEKLIDELNKLEKKNKQQHLPKINELKNIIDDNFVNSIHIITKFSNYMLELLSDCTLIKIADSISICENKYIRISQSLLNILNQSNRKATMVGIVAFKHDDNSLLGNPFSTADAESDEFLANGGNTIFGIAITNFDILNEGDYFVRPIAIYFEE